MANAKVINRMVNLTSFVETAKVPTADDIMTGKEAWANGVKVVGEGSGGGGGSGWQPDPLWTNIRALWDEDTLRKKVASGVTFYSDTALTTSVGTLASSHPVTRVESTYGTIVGDGTDGTADTTYYVAIADVTGDYIYSAIYLIAASDLTTLFRAGVRYITSDGYDSTTELASDYTHTWDLDDDMVDSTGAYTRWVITYHTAQAAIRSFNSKVLWVIHNFSSSTLGSSSLNDIYYLSYCPALKYVELKDNIKSISDYAFDASKSLISVRIPDWVTSIGRGAFRSCESLQYIEIPSSVTKVYDVYTFQNCFALQNVILGIDFDTSVTIPASGLFSQQVLHAMIAAYKDNSGEGGTARTLTIGAANLAKLTAEDIAVATAKNLTLA